MIQQICRRCVPVLLGCSLFAAASDLDSDLLIIDTHIDTPIRAYYQDVNILDGTNAGQFDLPRAKLGGLSTAFMSIYTPASAAVDGTSKAMAHELIDWVEAAAASSPELAIATCAADIRKLHAEKTIGLALGMENASPLEGDAANLAAFTQRGIRYITLAHSASNEFSDSSYDENEAHDGLSDAGRELVRVMNAQGVMIDISHLTDKAAWQVLELSQSPVLATHSSLRHFVPGFHRNMADEMVAAMKANGGVVHINFGSSFVSAQAREWQDQRTAALAAVNESGEMTRDERLAFYASYAAAHPYPFATTATVADHIDRVVELAGIDHVGLGSDYDGVGDTLPIGLKDVSMFPNLIAELRARGYEGVALRKILGENLMRVWEANESFATRHGSPPVCARS